MPVLSARTLFFSAALYGAGFLPAHGQAAGQPEPTPAAPPQPEPVAPELEPFEGRLIRKVTMRTPDRAVEGTGTVVPGQPLDAATEALARNQLRLREGMPFSAALVSVDISWLNRLGRFKRVESRVQG